MLRAADKWLAGYLRSRLVNAPAGHGPVRLLLCIADHFEPFRLRDADGVRPSADEARQTVRAWCERYRESAGAFADSDGRPPRHTCFYPEEDYDAECLAELARFCAQGFGEVELHLHHRHDTAPSLRRKLERFRNLLHDEHGLLGAGPDGAARFGFVHGNWALCNSRPDRDWCGVDEELGVLAEAGCYADFTFPSAPSPTQPRLVNAIYRARDRPGRPRGQDRGERVRVEARPGAGRSRKGVARELMLIQGPLALDWRNRKWGMLPRLENADLTGANPPGPGRLDLWLRQGIHVLGRPDWVVVKLHTHGCVAANAEMLLGPAMRAFHAHLAERLEAGRIVSLHYICARELYNMVRAAEDGHAGSPGAYRDYEILPPPVVRGPRRF